MTPEFMTLDIMTLDFRTHDLVPNPPARSPQCSARCLVFTSVTATGGSFDSCFPIVKSCSPTGLFTSNWLQRLALIDDRYNNCEYNQQIILNVIYMTSMRVY